MGGDQGPELLIDGALRALRKNRALSVILLGPEDLLKERIAQCAASGNIAERLLVAHAPEIITMEESPVEAIRKKKP
ncbi:MAG: phosphate--acyl-ACP acyltransferase, partial [Candidatus Electrothrix sp. LOE2]|nr:phosphate--acyl-ACP acyltransferase [Candidatus Electrothrix sp. LOE2]